MVGLGWNYPLTSNTWEGVRDFLSTVKWNSDEDRYPLDIIESVLHHGADRVLAIATSMHDLIVAPIPASDPPLDVIIVCAPGSPRIHPKNTIRVDFQTVNGAHTTIVRPVDEALKVFWRSLETAFGVRPTEPTRITIVHTRRGMLLTKETSRSWREAQEHVDDYLTSLGPYTPDELLAYLALEYPENPPFPIELLTDFLRTDEHQLWST